MKQALPLVGIVFLFGAVYGLSACSSSTVETRGLQQSASADASMTAIQTNSATPEPEMAAGFNITEMSSRTRLAIKRQAYLNEAKAQLEAFDQKIQNLKSANINPAALARLLERQDDAHLALEILATTPANSWVDARREVRRSLKRLGRCYDQVQAGRT